MSGLLTRIDEGGVGAVGAYADLAQEQGWPCDGFPSWSAWAADVTARLLVMGDRLDRLERLADQVTQQLEVPA